MTVTIPLSSKLSATAEHGFALRLNREPDYKFDWHMHDCAMLIWAQLGALDSFWMLDTDASYRTVRLTRATALLLPASAGHSTRSGAKQQHGELYLRPEMLGASTHFGAFCMDGAMTAMLDALSASALARQSREPLVHALLAQLAARHPAQWSHFPARDQVPSLVERMLACFQTALDTEQPMPSIEAVAQRLGVSMRKLQRSCAIETGRSPVMLRRGLLALQARKLLSQGISSTKASQQLGFTHSGHLNRLLRDIPS